MSDATIVLRSVTPDDLPFLRRVYASTREDELALTDWSAAEKEAFVAMQFDAQHHHYTVYYADAERLIINLGGRPIGRLYVDRQDDALTIVDIALLPEARNQGIGGALLRDLLVEAERTGKPVRIHVEKMNRAMRLYQRLGFTPIGEYGIYDHMEWKPGQSAT